MSTPTTVEWWQRGPVEGVLPVFQPAVHAILQARDELENTVRNFPNELLWQPLYGMASVGFHLQHIAGVLDRLLTYADGNALSTAQLNYLQQEGKEQINTNSTELMDLLNKQVEQTLQAIAFMKEDAPSAIRTIGRKQIPTTQLGLVFHAAEHMMRHTGQLLVTARVIKELNQQKKD